MNSMKGSIMDISSLFKSFISLMNTFGIADLLDVSVVAFIIYSLIKIICSIANIIIVYNCSC